MADYQRLQQQQHPSEALKGYLQEEGPSASKVVAVVTLLPVGATLLFLAGLTLTATVIGLALSTPLFVVFSPVLVPAAVVIGLAVTGFLTSGAFGITALSALSWLANHVRRMRGDLPEQAKWSVQDTAEYLGQKTREAGQTIQGKAQEGTRT
ncbi:hypothetical protein FNV43_RR20244 [Rhamnella rubrinervis]|uniref:Oleosin n=1 Tax=Rhamnella rubrinervis TaxID=2594499 RepID=A0A8K0DZC3_9ROSA|nr:hypothetical protein FNV43_RR20244 [Rhamnella rubrinervis]